MRILTAKISIENFLHQYKVEFAPNHRTSIHYLVGENGSGKTCILECLYKAVSATDGRRKIESGEIDVECAVVYQGNTLDAFTKFSWEGTTTQNQVLRESRGGESIFKDEPNRNNKHIVQFEKDLGVRSCVLSEVEINFKNAPVKSISPETADTSNPIEESSNLNTVIPQILTNLKSHDDGIKSQWIDDNQGVSVPDEIPGLKLSRFTNAYNEIFSGHKRFSRIEPIDGEFKVFFEDQDGIEVELSSLSSGEKQIIFRLGFILKNLDTMDNGTVFIDEPEISLHPSWQLKFKEFLLQIFLDKNVQIIIATHSPYIFGSMDHSVEECLHIDPTIDESKKLEFPNSPGGPTSSPSMSMVNFIAYKIPTTSLHIELYNEIQVRSGQDTVASAERWLSSNGFSKSNRSISGNANFLNDDGSAGRHSAEESLPTWIRNCLNHPMQDRQMFTDNDLSQSIQEMIDVL